MRDDGKIRASRAAREFVRGLIRWVERFPRIRILVMGDLIVDEYIWGRVERISPEAPVPVVQVTDRSMRLGGGANVAHNLRSLGADVLVGGVLGDDLHGRWMIQEFRRIGIPADGILLDSDRPSTLKTRVIAHSQQVVRIDHEDSRPLGEDLIDRLCGFLDAHGGKVQGIIISDYAKGVVTPRLMEAVRRWADNGRRIVAVDPKINRFSLYRDVTVVTPNHKEAAQGAGMEIRSSEDLLEAGARLLDLLQCEILLVTRGEEGMTLFQRGGGHLHIPTIAKEVYDVTGAGDTVISAFTLGLCAGASPQEAALLANLAAGIVVGEVGTATVSRERLLRILDGID